MLREVIVDRVDDRNLSRASNSTRNLEMCEEKYVLEIWLAYERSLAPRRHYGQDCLGDSLVVQSSSMALFQVSKNIANEICQAHQFPPNPLVVLQQLHHLEEDFDKLR